MADAAAVFAVVRNVNFYMIHVYVYRTVSKLQRMAGEEVRMLLMRVFKVVVLCTTKQQMNRVVLSVGSECFVL